MADRFKNSRYMLTVIKRIDGRLCYYENEDGTLFSGHHKTKMLPKDLPEWYLYGRFYKEWGYISTKGIVDMVYRPNSHVNHFLRDDFLYISYKDKITPVTEADIKADRYLRYEYYKGYDEVVCGSEIIDILKGAKQYSNYDITPLIEQLRAKIVWLRERFPDQFGEGHWQYDIDEVFSTEISEYARKRNHEIVW